MTKDLQPAGRAEAALPKQEQDAAGQALTYSASRLLGRSRGVGYWAFYLNRISGLVLTVYLLVHLGFLSALYLGPEAYNAFISVVSNRAMIGLDILLVAAVIYHGFNGVRISLVGLNIGAQRQAAWFWVAFVLGLLALAFMAVRLLAGG